MFRLGSHGCETPEKRASAMKRASVGGAPAPKKKAAKKKAAKKKKADK